jgi:hypothetical protein
VRFSSVALSVAIALTTIAPAPARAGTKNPDAQRFFAKGRTLRQGGDCAGAITEFRRAYEIAPEGLGALRNVAECEEKLGHFASARKDWWDLRRAAMQSNDPDYEGWEKDAEAAYRRLEPNVARLKVQLTGDLLDRVKVSVDGKPLDPRLVGVEIERDLGLHTIEATYGGVAPIVEKRTLAAGKLEVVTLAIPTPKPGEGKPPGEGTTPATGPSPMRIGGYVAVGVGALGALGTIAAIVTRQTALGAIAAKCPDYASKAPCDPSLSSERDKGKTASLLVNVFGAIAIAGIGVGIPLIVIGGRQDAPKPAAKPAASAVKVEAGVTSTAGGAALWAAGRF